MRKFLIVLFTFALAVSTLTANQGIWKLKSGEEFKGEEISRSEGLIVIKLPYGKLELNTNDIESENLISTHATHYNKHDEKVEPKTPQFRSISMTNMTRSILPQRTISKTSTTTTVEAFFPHWETEWMDDYKNFIHSYIPEGWLFKLRLGYADVVTNSSKNTIDTTISIEKTWDDTHEVFMYGFYNYAKEYFPSTKTSNVSNNKYGAGGEYAYKFLGQDSGFFTVVALDYKTDFVKYLDVLTDNMVGIGYEFMPLKDYGIDLDIAIGPGWRYAQYTWISLSGNETFVMGYVRQNLTCKITKNLKIEQRFMFAFDLNSDEPFMSEYYQNSMYLSVGLVYSPTDVFSIALRYTQDYDSANQIYKFVNNKYAEDSRFVISIEIPIGWKK